VPGRIRYISDAVINLAYQEVEGYDFELNYTKRTTDWGRFSWRSKATYLSFYGFSRTSRNPANIMGRASATSGYPRIRMQNSLLWTRKEWTGGITHTHTGRYGDFVRDGFEVEPYNTVNLFVGWDIPAGLLPYVENTRIGLSVDNVLDEEPPLFYDGVGYTQIFASRPAGRFFSISVRKAF
jgi:outer membrane receptor protein involved in Fe transport